MIENLASWIPSIIAPIGWFIVHILSKKRDFHAERRRFADTTINRIEQIESLAKQYHTNKSRSIENEEELLSCLQKLEDRLQYLTNKKNSFSFIPFKANITMYNFQTKDFTKQRYNSQLVRDISTSSITLINQLLNIK